MLLHLPAWMWCSLGLVLVTIPIAAAATGGPAAGTTGGSRSNSTRVHEPVAWPFAAELVGREELYTQFLKQLEDDNVVDTKEITSLAAKPQVSLEFYYLTTCPHCLTLIQHAVRPLIEAQLPGDRVQFTILPVLKGMSNRQQCMETGACHDALAPLCALNGSLPQPAPADSPELRRAVSFLACDLAFTADGLGNTPEVMQDCAMKAGLDWEELDACTKGPKVFDIMYSAAYSKKVAAAMHRLQKAHFAQPPSMPWLSLDGKLLKCGSEGCIAERTSSGDIPLPQPGSLLALVCAKLDPQPKACANVQRSMDPTSVEAEARIAEAASRCENCAEVGPFSWHARSSHGAEQASLFLLVLVLSVVSAGVLVRASSTARSAFRPPEHRQTSRSLQLSDACGPAGRGLQEEFDLHDPELPTE